MSQNDGIVAGSIEPVITISAVITRADGTVEDQGVIASTEDGSIRVESGFSAWAKRLLKGNAHG